MTVKFPACESRTRAIAVAAVAAAACASLFSTPCDLPESVGPVRRRRLRLVPPKDIVRHNVRRDPPPTAATADPPAWYEDIDYGRQDHPCGSRKCFFRSEADPSRGYLVENWIFENIDRHGSAVRAYEYAKMLEEEHGIRHFHAGPPFVEDIPPHFEERLTDPREGFYRGTRKLIVQPSATAPEGSIVLRCHGDGASLGTQLEDVLRDMDPAAKANLVGELEGTIAVVAARPELVQDFQLMVDKEGRIYHLDFDRVIFGVKVRENYTKPFEGCLEGAVEYVKMDMANEDLTEEVTEDE